MPPRGFDWLRATACTPELRLFGFLTDVAGALAIGGETMKLSALPAWAQSCVPAAWRKHELRQGPLAEVFGQVFTRRDAPLADGAQHAPWGGGRLPG